jgi:hypothetical protein
MFLFLKTGSQPTHNHCAFTAEYLQSYSDRTPSDPRMQLCYPTQDFTTIINIKRSRYLDLTKVGSMEHERMNKVNMRTEKTT